MVIPRAFIRWRTSVSPLHVSRETWFSLPKSEGLWYQRDAEKEDPEVRTRPVSHGTDHLHNESEGWGG